MEFNISNAQKVFNLCKANGIKLRNMRGFNFKGTLPNGILYNLDRHKNLIMSIKALGGKPVEWEDVTLNHVYLEISF